jgi:hypothetical protein
MYILKHKYFDPFTSALASFLSYSACYEFTSVSFLANFDEQNIQQSPDKVAGFAVRIKLGIRQEPFLRSEKFLQNRQHMRSPECRSAAAISVV